MHGALLEVLSQHSAVFISELKTPRHLQHVLRTCVSLCLEQYAVDEINYTLSYLFDTDLSFDNVQDAKDYLRRKLNIP